MVLAQNPSRRRLVLLAMAIATALIVTSAPGSAAEAPPADIEAYLLPDGRVDLDALWATGHTGSVNFAGYQVALSGRAPEYAASPPDRAAGDEHWVKRFPLPFPGVSFRTAVEWNGQLHAATYDEIYRFGTSGWTRLDGYVNGSIQAMLVHGGDLIVAGDFTLIGDVAANRIARYDGHAWHAMGFGMNDPVWALALFDGQIVAGGGFTVAGSGYAQRIAAWNGAQWVPLGDGLNDEVYALLAHDGRLVAGGYFHSAGPVIANHIAAWDGAGWSALGNGTDGSVMTLANHDGRLVAGGDFQSAGTLLTGTVAVWDGAGWQGLGGLYRHIQSLAVVGGMLYAGLESSWSGGEEELILAWNDPVWTVIAEGEYSSVMDLLDHEGQLLALISSHDSPSAHLWDGAVWSALVGPGLDGEILAMTMYGDDLIVAGAFNQAGDVEARGLAGWDGSSWYPLGSGLPGDWFDDGDCFVGVLTVHDGLLIAGGRFEEIGGTAAMNIAAWNGAAWSPLGDGLGDTEEYRPVRALLSYGDELIAGGRFDASGETPLQNLAAWNGAAWTDLAAGYSAQVNALAVHGGDLIVGGYGLAGSYQYVAGLGGSGWYSLEDGVDGEVSSLAVHGGDLVVGGRFYYAGGQPADRLAAWDGSAWSPLALSVVHPYGGSGTVTSLASHAGRLYVGGQFVAIDGVAASNVASWDGASWGGLGSGIGSSNNYGNDEVNALLDMGGRLAVGGDFTRVGGLPCGKLALYDLTASPVGDQPPARPVVHLEQNHPNPFNPSTSIAFTVPTGGGRVGLRIVDLSGRLVRTLVDRSLPAGRHTVAWNGLDDGGRAVASGSYVYRYSAGGVVEARKMVLVR